MTKRKLTITAAVVVFLGVLGYGIYLAISRAGKEPVTVYLTPSDTILTANGEQIPSGTAFLKPGVYTLEASRSGFGSYKSSFTVRQPNTAEIDIALSATSQSAREWQMKHQDLYLAKERREGQRATKRGEEFALANPITTKLPYKNLIYTIGYRVDPTDPSDKSIILEIDASSGYRSGALQKIRDLGYDPTDFKINFKNYTSPF